MAQLLRIGGTTDATLAQIRCTLALPPSSSDFAHVLRPKLAGFFVFRAGAFQLDPSVYAISWYLKPSVQLLYGPGVSTTLMPFYHSLCWHPILLYPIILRFINIVLFSCDLQQEDLNIFSDIHIYLI